MHLLGLIVCCFGFFRVFTAIAAERVLMCKDDDIPAIFEGHSCACDRALICSLPEAGAS